MSVGGLSQAAAAGSGASSYSLRQHNLSLLALAVAQAPSPLSRADLAAATGLNRSTLTRLAEHLLAQGIVVERGARAALTGRPSVPLHPAPHTYVAVGAEIAPEYLELCVVDLTGSILVERHHEFAVGLPQRASLLAEFAHTVNELQKQVTASGMVLVGVSCGLPGLVDSDGYLHLAPNLGWRDVDLKAAVRDSGTDLDVTFHNSAGLAAYAETRARSRRGQPLEDFLFVTGSSGIGSALVRRGEVENGTRGWAGELGHIVVPDAEGLCSCGARGCLETVASHDAILENAGFGRSAPLGKLFAALSRGDRRASDSVRLAGRALGTALSSYLNLVDTPVVVLGSLLERLYAHLAPEIEQALSQHVLSHGWAPVQISRATAGPHMVSEGAAWQVLMNFLQRPDEWRHLADGALTYYSVDETPEVTVE